MAARDSVLAPLDGKSPTLFLVAGAVLVVFAGVNVAQALTDPTAYEALHAIFGPGGFVFGFLGLLGLYPVLADRSPKLARVGAVSAAIGAVGAAVTSLAHVGVVAGVFPAEPPAFLAAFAIGIFVGMVPGFLSFAAATLRTDVHSRTLGLLLLAPPVVFGVMLVGGVVLGGAALGAVVLSSGQAVSHVAIGYTLQTETVPTDRTEPAADPTP